MRDGLGFFTLLLLSGCAALPSPAPIPTPTPAAIEDRMWSLVELNGQALPAVPLPRLPLLALREGRVSGFSGCNRFSGGYTLQGEALRFGPAAGTRMACAEGMALEGEFLHLLPHVTGWRLQGDTLTWLNAQGQPVARLSPHLQRYRCDDGSPLWVRTQGSSITLALGGREYAMRSAPSASGARFVVEQGRRPDWSMEWHVKGDDGLLLEAPLDHTRKPEDLKPFARCRVD